MLSAIWFAGPQGCYVLTSQKLKVREGVRCYFFLEDMNRCYVLRVKNLKAHKGVIFYLKNIFSLLKVFVIFGNKLKANLCVMCYLHIFANS